MRPLKAPPAVAQEAWGSCALEPARSEGRLHRQKLRVQLDPGTAHVLALERYEVRVHEPEVRPLLGGGSEVRVESPAEIVADKVAAAIDRFASRGMIKLRDVFDIAFLLGIGRPGRELVLAKLADYGYPQDLARLSVLADALDETAAERLRAELKDVLPQPDLERFRPAEAVRKVGSFFRELGP